MFSDSQSANGVFINGIAQKSKVMVTLKINDIIGLGCASTVPGSYKPGGIPTIFVLRRFEVKKMFEKKFIQNFFLANLQSSSSFVYRVDFFFHSNV